MFQPELRAIKKEGLSAQIKEKFTEKKKIRQTAKHGIKRALQWQSKMTSP